MKVRMVHVAADGACLGVGIASLIDLFDWAARHGLGDIAAAELLRLKLLGSFPRILFFAGRGLSWRAALVLLLVAALVVGRRTRRLLVGAVVAASAAWIAAFACAAAYALDPAMGLLTTLVALVATAVLARRRTWSIAAMVLLASGLLVGFFLAQNVLMVRPEVTGGISPLYGFLPAAMVSLVTAHVLSRRRPDPPMGSARRLMRFWGLCTVSLCVTSSVAIETVRVRSRLPDPTATRVTDEFTYDVRVEGQPPAVVWTNRKRIQVLENAYGDTHRRYALDDSAGFPERIWSSRNGGFYIQSGRSIGWWSPAPDSQPIPARPSAAFLAADWVPAAFVEDPNSLRGLLVSEWLSQYAVVDRDTSTPLASGAFSGAVWSWPYATVDPSARVAFISTGMDDGHLYVFDFHALRITRAAPNLYLYETVLDPAAGLLWGARPFTGEVLGVDTHTLEIRHRIPVEPMVRDIQRDTETGDLFTCSFMFGDVFRIDRRTLAPSNIGWCGRFCRNLFFDARQRTLWVATADGLCRIALSGSAAPPQSTARIGGDASP